jgi:hypothetical protein
MDKTKQYIEEAKEKFYEVVDRNWDGKTGKFINHGDFFDQVDAFLTQQLEGLAKLKDEEKKEKEFKAATRSFKIK